MEAKRPTNGSVPHFFFMGKYKKHARKVTKYLVKKYKKKVGGLIGAGAFKQANDIRGTDRSSLPSTSAIDKYHPLQSSRYSGKRKFTKYRKRAYKRQKRFTNKVLKAVRAPQSMSVYREAATSNGAYTIATVGVPTWNTTPRQVVSGDGGTGYGYMFSGAGVTKDLSSLITELIKRQERYNATDKSAKQQGIKFYVTFSEMEFTLMSQVSQPFNVDFYECVAARDMEVGDTYGSAYTAFVQCLTDLSSENAGGVTSTSTAVDFGLEPTDLAGFGKHWRIMNRTTFFMDANAQTTFKIKGPTGTYDMKRMINLMAQKGKTRSFLFICLNRMGAAIPINTTFLNYVWNKTYHYKFFPGSEHLTGVVVNQFNFY